VYQTLEIESIDADFSAMLSEILIDKGLIKIPEGAKYTMQDLINVLLCASSSCANSIELAVSDIKQREPEAIIPSADTIHNYIKTNSIARILSSFREINREFLSTVEIPDEPQDAAVDFHDIGYYGDRNTPGIRGIKPKNGTSWGHSFFTIDLVGKRKITLDIINISALNKNYPILLKGAIERTKSMGVILKTLFLDREFFNLPAISTLHDMGNDYIMPAKSNQKINRMLREHIKKRASTADRKV
jgi:hypothetical protein